MPKHPMSPETRERVLIRDAYACRYCLLSQDLEIHHRQGRGGANPNRLSNLLTLCRRDHQWTTEHPAEAYKLGLSVRRTGIDQPDEVPFRDYYGNLWALTDEGDRFRLAVRAS